MSSQFVRYEDVKNQSTEEYFRGNQFSIDAFNKKYVAFDGETYVKALKRVCDNIASVEENTYLQEYWSQRWFDEIYNDWWHPSGSIMSGAGSTKKISTANCTTISLGSITPDEEWDNLESIIRNTTYTVAKCAAYRQGLGVDFSRLRPREMEVHNSSRKSCGAIHWMKLVDSIGYYVGQKGRIPAMLFSLSCSHPDLIEFIKAKSDFNSIQNANISVQCTEKFYEAVENDLEWEMSFDVPEITPGQKIFVDIESATSDCIKDPTGRFYYIAKQFRPAEKIVRQEKARYLLELIAKHMYERAEPGIQNIDLARHYSNSDYVYDNTSTYDSKIISSNACSEQYLSRESLCVLASQNAGRFPVNHEDFEREQARIASSMNRFLDNVNEAELRNKTYATPHQKLAIEKLRRTGAGFTNLASWLFKQNISYGTTEAVEAVRYYTERFNYYLYRQSINSGKEKGSFGLFNREKLEKSPFIKRMVDLGLEFDALRNVTCSSIAPTGTLSLMFREEVMSYGAEPGFGIYYWKRTRMSGKYEYYFCVPGVVRNVFAERGYPLPMDSDTFKDTWDGRLGQPIAEFIDRHKDQVGIQFRKATEVSPFDKLDMMSAMMDNIDSSISITYLLPEHTNWKDVYDFILLAHKKGVKSIAAFPDRQMYGIVSLEPFKELAQRLTEAGVNIHEQNFTTEELTQLNCTSFDKISKNNSPQRPKELPCDIHHMNIAGKPWFVVVGLLSNEPYEVFCTDNTHMHYTNDSSILLSKKQNKGILRKAGRGEYHLLSEEGEKLLPSSLSGLLDSEQEALTRMVSTSLRHGVDCSFITAQLQKTRGDLQSFSKCLSRALKKYVKDGTVVSGSACPQCAEQLVFSSGCSQCVQCGYSKCN